MDEEMDPIEDAVEDVVEEEELDENGLPKEISDEDVPEDEDELM